LALGCAEKAILAVAARAEQRILAERLAGAQVARPKVEAAPAGRRRDALLVSRAGRRVAAVPSVRTLGWRVSEDQGPGGGTAAVVGRSPRDTTPLAAGRSSVSHVTSDLGALS